MLKDRNQFNESQKNRVMEIILFFVSLVSVLQVVDIFTKSKIILLMSALLTIILSDSMLIYRNRKWYLKFDKINVSGIRTVDLYNCSDAFQFLSIFFSNMTYCTWLWILPYSWNLSGKNNINKWIKIPTKYKITLISSCELDPSKNSYLYQIEFHFIGRYRFLKWNID